MRPIGRLPNRVSRAPDATSQTSRSPPSKSSFLVDDCGVTSPHINRPSPENRVGICGCKAHPLVDTGVHTDFPDDTAKTCPPAATQRPHGEKPGWHPNGPGKGTSTSESVLPAT